MSHEDFRAALNAMRVQAAINDAQVRQVRADPITYLQEAGKRMYELHKVLEEVQRALSPCAVFDKAEEMGMHPMDIQGEALIRCNAASKVLDNYFHPQGARK